MVMSQHARNSDARRQAPFWCQPASNRISGPIPVTAVNPYPEDSAGCGSLCRKWKRQPEKTYEDWHQRVPGVAMGGAVVDCRVAACLYSIVGLGQSAALVRCRSDSCLRGFVVGKLPVDFQPGHQLAGRWSLLGHGHWLAARQRAISRRRNELHVGSTGASWGAAPFQLSHRSPFGAALGHAQNRLRPPRSCLTSSDCGGTFHRFALFACWVQYELCGSRPALSSLLGTRSRSSCRDLCWSRRARLLADPLTFELAVSCGWRH